MSSRLLCLPVDKEEKYWTGLGGALGPQGCTLVASPPLSSSSTSPSTPPSSSPSSTPWLIVFSGHDNSVQFWLFMLRLRIQYEICFGALQFHCFHFLPYQGFLEGADYLDIEVPDVTLFVWVFD